MGVALGVGVTALVLQRSFDDVRAHYVFAGLAAAFTAGLVTYGLGGQRVPALEMETEAG